MGVEFGITQAARQRTATSKAKSMYPAGMVQESSVPQSCQNSAIARALAEYPMTYFQLLYDQDCSDSLPPNYQQFAYETVNCQGRTTAQNRKEFRYSLSAELHEEHLGQRLRINL